ncbi:hypothetical protein BG011_010107 [Mortierella polycephala]|uniref:Cobalamin adenosyltransferase-like domain-containing protein n=1 Tax=Mortierella polycephala TaxID=41804 RepID=A0A9P6QCC8_9FUNG|nr:hypothetical protein BG011_010107 [Mortierella polycephala]
MTSEHPKKSRLYTRTGDRGESSLYNGERRLKTDRTFEALGAVDELNSSIGIAYHYCKKSANGLGEQLIEIQCNLQDIGANIATPRNDASETKLQKTTFEEVHIEILEKKIDALDAICRRAERTTIPVVEANDADETVLKYLNRLSDYLFAAARFAAKHDGMEENSYKKPKTGEEASIQTRTL